MNKGNYDPGRTVGEFVTESPARSKLFEELGLDFCCGGDRPLSEAAETAGLELESVLDRLLEFDSKSRENGEDTDWRERPMGELIDHIVKQHHGYLRDNLPRLKRLVTKVNELHGDNHPELAEVEREFGELEQELREHMLKEEGVFFPICRELQASEISQEELREGLGEPVDQLEHEHDEASHSLERMRELTGGFSPPDDACNTYRAMLDGLEELEHDLHLHIHEENNILFPRAAERAEELRSSG